MKRMIVVLPAALAFVFVAGGSTVANELSKPAQPKHDSVQIHFLGPAGTQINWSRNKDGSYDSPTLIVPAAHDLLPGRHQFKLTAMRGRPGVRLYPSLTLPPPSEQVQQFLAECRIAIRFTEEDLDHALAGNMVTKVLYLPDPEFDELTFPGLETSVSERLDPGVDPIKEADKRGTIVAIVRMGNRDKEKPSANAAKVQPAPAKKATDHQHQASRNALELIGVSQPRSVAASVSIREVVSPSAK